MEGLTDLIVLTLAAGAVVDVWFQGSIFDEYRATAEAYLDAEGEIPRWKELLSELLTCHYCLSYHIPLYLGLLAAVPAVLFAHFLGHPLGRLFWIPIYALAATRLSLLLDNFLPLNMRYRRPEEWNDGGDDLTEAPAAGDGGDDGGTGEEAPV